MGCLGGIDLLNLVFELKFLNVFVGREDPIEFYIYLFILFCLCLFCRWVKCFVGVMGGILFNSSLFLYIYIYLF